MRFLRLCNDEATRCLVGVKGTGDLDTHSASLGFSRPPTRTNTVQWGRGGYRGGDRAPSWTVKHEVWSPPTQPLATR